MGKLDLNPEQIEKGRELARGIISPVLDFIHKHTTVAVERAVLRLYGVDGVDAAGVPLPNIMVEQVTRAGGLGKGVSYWLGRALVAHGLTLNELGLAVARGEVDLAQVPAADAEKTRLVTEELALEALQYIREQRRQRESLLTRLSQGPQPWLYVIVATGNIYEDIVQARAAARQGADIVAVIRSTGQSLLDYVPHGPTTEGFGGTYATRANFRLMRQALDEAGEEVGRYIRLTNYSSGLCMPEIAAMGAQERLDVMLNDAMYGIIFRDINMRRTFIDQHFSRLINGFAGIIINTGEDNYLTTADAYEQAHTVLASQFINEQFALAGGLPEEQIGLGHAFELNPGLENGFLYELAQAQLVREVFPRSPVKYMPPTKYMTGNIFLGQVQNALFNVAGVMTGQGIQLLGMLTEAIHTPFLHDRFLSIENARYIFNNLRHLAGEISFVPGGRIQRRAREVLQKAVEMLQEIEHTGLMEAISRGRFAAISRSPAGGRGLEGVVPKEADYENPFSRLLQGQRGEKNA